MAVSLFVLVFFRTVSSGHLWNGYCVLAVISDCPDKIVMSSLKAKNCSGVISLSSQSIPLLSISSSDPAVSLASSDLQQTGNYLKERERYFFDRSMKHRLYYVPDTYEKQVAEVAVQLTANSINATLDSKMVFPWIMPVLCFFYALFLMFFSTDKLLFGISASFLVLFSLSVPFYLTAASVCLLLPMLFLVLKIWRRDGADHFFLKNPVIILFFIVSFILSILTSVRSCFLFLFSIIAVVSVLSIAQTIEKNDKNKVSFKPVMIRPAEVIVFTSKTLQNALYGCMSCILILFVFLLFSSNFLVSTGIMELPSGRAGSGSNLPGLNDYIIWTWNTETYPYRSLNENKYKGERLKRDSIIFPHYAENDRIKEEDQVVFRYDNSFRQQVVAAIDKLPFPAIEQLLKKEGRYGRAGYVTEGTNSGGVKTILLLVVALIVSAFSAVIYTITSRKAAFWSKK
jgi:hypothetical protein